MKTFFKFFFHLPDVRKHLPSVSGKNVDGWYEVIVESGDTNYCLIGETHKRLESKSFMGGIVGAWDIFHQYQPKEVLSAELFRMYIKRSNYLLMASNQTVYDWSGICNLCGAGRKQIKPLEINVRRLPKSKKIVYTIGMEWLINEALAEALNKENFSGFEIKPVLNEKKASSDELETVPFPNEFTRYPSGRELVQKIEDSGIDQSVVSYYWLDSGPFKELWRKCVQEHNEWGWQRKYGRTRPPSPWYQLGITSNPLATCAPTRFGINPFDADASGQYRCPLGHTSGLNLLSEVSVRRNDWDGSDLVATSNLVGFGGGLGKGYSVPEPMVLVSPQLRQFLISQKARGLIFDVAYLVN